MRIYIACLASYNNGRLFGEWIDADDADTMREEVARILRASPYPNVRVTCPDCDGEGIAANGIDAVEGTANVCELCAGTCTVPSAEEYAVHDYDGIPSSFGEYPDLDAIAAYVAAVEEHGEAYADFFEHLGQHDSRDADDFAVAYAGTFSSLEDYAADYVESSGMLHGVPDFVARYFDYEAFARDLRTGGDVWTVDCSEGVHVFHAH